MIQENYFTDDRDLQFLFRNFVNWENVAIACEGKDFIEHKEYIQTGNPRLEMAPGSVEEAIDLYYSTLDSLGELFGKELSLYSGENDKIGLRYENGKVIFPESLLASFERLKQSGLMPYAISRRAEGLGMPMTVSAIYAMIMARGDVSLCMTANLLNLAQIVYRYGTEEQIEQFTVPASRCETVFAMSLTEPDYGSDLNSVTTIAQRQEDGKYRITGTKRFISQGCGIGDTPALLLTLARTGKKGSGARGLSVFLNSSRDVQVAGIEKKMGIHASPTCELVYEETIGELLGEEGAGLTRCTSGMTNFMRLASAGGGAGGGAAAYYESLKYAGERLQFGKPIKEIPAVREMLDKMRRESNAMRLLALETGYSVDMFQHEQIRKEKNGISDREIRQDPEFRKWNSIAGILTPLAKYHCSEEGNKLAYLAVQVHGGAGYTEDYDVSRIYRDARINSIYEGTSQIQVRISIGGLVSGMSKDGIFRRYIEELREKIDRYKELIDEQERIFENSLEIFRGIKDEDRKQKLSECLIVIAVRAICSLLYAGILNKVEEDSDLSYWITDCKDFLIESTGMMKANEYRMSAYAD
ncbi:MAG: acyl-CoA dehydrogenase family protein [Leptospiraceae bacterium]|nr:acyl-CoA dehydrogenase family protein [Leptospiraceae bacterium]MCP5510966.1 acyl-CoA dehydrogenase family protein [Leptospiraceae bacterium]